MSDKETKAVVVLKNCVPDHYDLREAPHDIKNYGTPLGKERDAGTATGLIPFKPALSAFEITLNGYLLWSKLDHMSFPDS